MLSIKRLTRKLGKQTLNEVKPAPVSETVDHTVPFVHEFPTSFQTDPSESPVLLVTSESKDQETPSCSVLALPSHSESSSDSETEEPQKTKARTKGCLRPLRKKLLTSELKIERVSSAEKRKYSQYKCSTGSSSSAGSSDEEIKEAFEGHSLQCELLCDSPPLHHNSWTPPKDIKIDRAFAWHSGLCVTPRPLKVVPAGHRKPKFFAQMTASHSRRPHIDFDKMQHSKRLNMVRRPVAIRNNSKIHSLHRPPSLQVSLDISKHKFQPVLTQT